MCERDASLSRRQVLAGAGGAAAAGALASVPTVPVAVAARPRRLRGPIGSGGAPTDIEDLARLATRVGRGEPLVFCDLAAVDQNTKVIADWARRHEFAIRPALKAFQSPKLCAYILRQLPEPRGMVFHLSQVGEILAAAPPGTDLLMGYVPTVGQLERYLRRPPRRRRGQRVRILLDSVELIERAAHHARDGRHPLPLDVALEFDSGMGRGGMDSAEELSASIKLLRKHRRQMRLGAVLCYDGHATLNGSPAYRQTVAEDARARYRGYLDQLAAEGGDLYNARTLVRNGPASSNYRNWAGTDEANEISPGSAFVFAGYLEAFDNEGLAPAITQASPVMRITGDHPSVPATQDTPPGANREEIIIEAGPWAGSSIIHPPGIATDEASGGGFALSAPKGSVGLGSYVLMRPAQSGDGIDPFGSVIAIREGRVLRRWPTLSRWSAS